MLTESPLPGVKTQVEQETPQVLRLAEFDTLELTGLLARFDLQLTALR